MFYLELIECERHYYSMVFVVTKTVNFKRRKQSEKGKFYADDEGFFCEDPLSLNKQDFDKFCRHDANI